MAKLLLPLWLALLSSLSFASSTLEDHAELTRRFLETYSLESKTPEEVPLEVLFEGHFASARVGLIDLRISAHELDDKRTAAEFVSLVRAVLVAQKGWLEWMGNTAPEGEARIADFELIEKDFKRFKPDLLVKAAKQGDREFFAAQKTSDAALEALARVNKYMASGAPLGLEREDKVSPLVVFPKRKGFVEFISYVGWTDSYRQPYYWVDGTEVWNECFVDDVRAACLEFPALTRGDYTKGSKMNEKNPLEMEEQFTQLAGLSLYGNYYGERLPGALVGGLANNLVISIYGEVDTRLDGSLKGNETSGRSVFIPGGRSEGGLLPENSADNRWREYHGKHYFLKALKKAQKAGKSHNKSTKHKYKSFLLVNQSGSERHVTTAPVFGAAGAGSSAPPATVADDYAEFLRAYKSGFLYWLQTGVEGKKNSRQRFAEFFQELAQGSPQDFEAAIEKFYGAPLSSKELGKDDLEGRFLKFVSK